MAALCGDRRGKLDPRTPLPPLVHHVRAEWKRLKLTPEVGARTVTLRRADPKHLERRLVLERLILLGVAGFRRAAGTAAETTYELVRLDTTESSLLEARARMTDAIAREPSLEVMVGWMRHGGLQAEQLDVLVPVAESAVDRSLWLLEGMHGDVPVSLERVHAVVAIRDAALQQLGTGGHVLGVMDRVTRAWGRWPASGSWSWTTRRPWRRRASPGCRSSGWATTWPGCCARPGRCSPRERACWPASTTP